MKQEKLMEADINYVEGVKRFAGKVPIYEKYLKQFIEDVNFSKLEAQMQNGAYTDAFETAHVLKGLTGTLGMDGLFNVTSKLVEALRANHIEEAEGMMAAVRAEYKRVMGILKNACME